MRGIEIAVLSAGTLWLAMLSFVTVLVVRQIALITARLDAAGSLFSVADDGLEVGNKLSQDMLSRIPELRGDLAYVLVISATCMPCRELASELATLKYETPPTIALLAGREELAQGLQELLPTQIGVIRDPDATDLANDGFQLQSTPFAFQVEHGTITGKAYLRSATHLLELIQARKKQDHSPVNEPQRMAEGEEGGIRV